MQTLRKTLVSAALCASLLPGLSSAAVLGLVPGEPVLDFSGVGMIDYDATTGTVTISGDPIILLQNDPFILGEVMPTGPDSEKYVTISFKVDNTGALVDGVGAMTVYGAIDVDFDTIPEYDGVLLQADVDAFGFQDGGASNDTFDMRMTNVTGLLAANMYPGKDLAVVLTSEISAEFPNAFNGSFAANFTGHAKGNLGSVDPVVVVGECSINVEAYCSVNGSPNTTKCRIKAGKSSHHWLHVPQSYHGNSCHRAKYGMHGNPEPMWVKKYPATNVKFTYVVTNTGTTEISDLVVDDSFDIGVTGVPTTLAAGASITLMRTEGLRDGLTNTVLASGVNGSATCSDTDNVVITDKMKNMKLHHLDHYKHKHHGGH
ncbi:MAG: hypothetical protein ABL877_12240 [Thiobacillus sp.]